MKHRASDKDCWRLQLNCACHPKKNLQGLHAKPRGQNERRWQPCCREECGDPQQLKKNCLISGKSLELSKYTSCIFVISVQSPAVIYSCRRPAKCVLLLPVLLFCAPQPCLTLGSVFRGRSSPAQQILIVHEGVWHLWPCDLLRYRRATPSKNKLDTSRAGPAAFPPPVAPRGCWEKWEYPQLWGQPVLSPALLHEAQCWRKRGLPGPQRGVLSPGEAGCPLSSRRENYGGALVR